MSATKETVTIKASLNGRNLNVAMDTGAGCCVIDYKSLEYVGLHGKIQKCDNHLINASGKEMDIIGVVGIPVVIDNNKAIQQEFKVLNSNYAIILMGRDFMKQLATVKFDFKKGKVQLCKWWINCVNVKSSEKVRLKERTVIPPRSETLISVRC